MTSPTVNHRPRTPRRLPSLPGPIRQLQAKRSSRRPLPTIPTAFLCKTCTTCITSQKVLFPESALPLGSSLAFRGFFGKASLFTEAYNVVLGPPNIHLMMTGAHTMQEISCSSCSTYVGWKIVRAHDKSESWKEGSFLLELENLYTQSDILDPLEDPSTLGSWQSSLSNSDSEHSP